MVRRLKSLAASVVVIALLTINVSLVSAHPIPFPPSRFHWDRTGSQIIIQSYIYGDTAAQAEAARQDAWNKIGILYNYGVNYHTDISVFGDNFGNTGWLGVMSIESSSSSGGHSHILHAHARYNSFYGGSSLDIQRVYCEEVFHAYGFDHDTTDDCMNHGSAGPNRYYLGSHNNDDFYNLYRFH